MLLHKEIESLKITTYSRFPHFQLTLVIDHRRHHHNRQCDVAIHDEMGSRCSKSKILRHMLDY
jgi:hypothetical protein